MKILYISVLAIFGLIIGNLTALAIDPPSMQLDAGPADTEPRVVPIEMVSMDLSEVGGDGEDIGGKSDSDPGVMLLEASSEPTPTLYGDDAGIEHEDIGIVDPDEETKESGEKGGTEDINIGMGEMQETAGDDKHDKWIDVLSASDGGEEMRMNKAELIDAISNKSNGGLRAQYVKLGDIKGESDDSASQDGGLDLDDDNDGATAAKTSKPKEIVVVGSKVRDESVPQLWRPEVDDEVLADGQTRRVPDSFFDVWVDAADSEDATTADSFFDVFVDVGDGRSMPDSFFDIFVDVTDDDLQLQAVSVAQSDKNVKEIKLTENEVRVDYFEEVKLFGLIPVKTTKTITVNTNAAEQISRVKVKMPWWHVFGRKTVRPHDLQTAIEEELNKAIPAQTDTDDRPTEEVAFYYNKISAQTLQTISNVSKRHQD